MDGDLEKFIAIAGARAPGRYEARLCPDQVLGTITVKAGELTLVQGRKSLEDLPAADPLVLLILESPHTEEFRGALGPAKGTTGRNIQAHLAVFCPRLKQLPPGQYHLALINAVQYQCSLGQPPGAHRNEVFVAAWKAFGEADFKERINRIPRERAALLINACTKGPEKNPLRLLAEKALIAIGRPSDIKVFHPACWARKVNSGRMHNKPVTCTWGA